MRARPIDAESSRHIFKIHAETTSLFPAPSLPSARGIGGVTTIDSTPVGPCGDNGALLNYRKFFSKGGRTYRDHLDPQSAANNLVGDIPDTGGKGFDCINIVGHGSPGVLVCGGGNARGQSSAFKR